MKHKITILAAMFFIATLTSFATVHTVSNHPLDGAQYTTLTAAYTAAVNGDTLLIEGTGIVYTNSVNWAKALVVIGIGFNTVKQQFQRTQISTSGSNDFNIATAGSNSKFYGINFTAGVTFTTVANNVLFEDCIFTNEDFEYNGLANTNIVFRNCVFDLDNNINLNLSGGTAATSTIISNCIFDGDIVGNSNLFNMLNVDHCLFLRTSTTAQVIQGVKNATFSNNIFMNVAVIANSNTTGCIFLNNISRLATTYPPAGNSGSGNLSNTDPNFVTYTLGSLYSTAFDFHLQAGSAAIGTATDATDIGLHGGTSKFSEQGEPLNAPVMRSMQINNTTVSPNGTLNVDISASKPDDN